MKNSLYLSALVVCFTLAVLATARAVVPQVVFVSQDWSSVSNQTHAAIEYSINKSYEYGILNVSTFPTFTLQREILGQVSAASLSALVARLRLLSQPVIVFNAVPDSAIGIELGQANITFVDLSQSRSNVESSELQINFGTGHYIGAAVDFLSFMQWNSTIVVHSSAASSTGKEFEAQARVQNVLVESVREVIASSPGTITSVLPELLRLRSNAIVLISGKEELDILVKNMTDLYQFQLVWIPFNVPTLDAFAIDTVKFHPAFRAMFSIQPQFKTSILFRGLTETYPALFPTSAGIPPSVAYAHDASILWAHSLASSSNPSNTAEVLASARAITSISRNMVTGTVSFDASYQRVGELSVANHIIGKSSVSVATWSIITGINSISASNYTFSSGTNVKPTATHEPVFVVGMLVDSMFQTSIYWKQVAQLAVRQINARKIIPGWEMRASFFDDGFTISGTLRGAFVLAEQQVQAIVGGTSSSLAIAAHNYLAPLEIPLISGSSTSDTLSDKVAYPYFVRTIAPDRLQGRVVADLAQSFNWSYTCALDYEDNYATNLVSRFISEASTLGNSRIIRSTISASYSDVDAAIKLLVSSDCRIIFAVAATNKLGVVLNEAKRQGLLGPGYQWIFPESLYAEFDLSVLRQSHNIDPRDVAGTLLVSQRPGAIESSVFQAFARDLASFRQAPTLAVPDNYSPYVWDSFWSLAYAARTLASVSTPGGLTNRTAYRNALFNVHLDGVTGKVGFDANGDRTDMPYSIYNLQPNNGGLVEVGVWESNRVSINASRILFADGSRTPPLDVLPTPESAFLFSWGGITALTVAACVVLVLLLVTCVMVFIYRTNNLIYRSSPVFLILILFGLILATMSVFFWFGDAATWKCHFRIWFGFVGFAIAYGALLAKNARLWYLFNEPSLRIIAITNKQLMFYLSLLAAPQLIVLILWSSLSPFVIVPTPNSSRTLNYLLCSSQKDFIFAPLSLAYMGLLLIVGGFLSFKTRTLPDIFRESQKIGLATYNYIFVATVCVIIAFAIASEPLAGVTVALAGILFGVAMNWLLLFIPKFYLIIFKPEVVAAMSHTTRTRKTGNSNNTGSNTGGVSVDKSAVSMQSVSIPMSEKHHYESNKVEPRV